MTPRHARLLAFALTLTSFGSAIADAPPLGRLFFTPEKREQLDRQRALNALTNKDVSEDPNLTVNGLVIRSSGRRTMWVNQIPQTESQKISGIAGQPGKRHGRIVLEADEEPATEMRVGETFNRETHEVRGKIGSGRIDVGAPGGRSAGRP